MPKRMLIDASHPEETRVVVLDGQKVEEFDFEAATKRPLKGNIYLAKVTRVEPSLQAAFVEYGGNRQGFLAFSEIHPDYYQIPVADRQALLAEQEAEARRRSDDEFESFDTITVPSREPSANAASDSSEEAEEEEEEDEEERDEEETSADTSDDEADAEGSGGADEPAAAEATVISEPIVEVDHTVAETASTAVEPAPEPIFGPDEEIDIQVIGPEDAAAQGEVRTDTSSEQSESSQRAQAANRPTQRWVRRRHYKIQEVIKRRQVILVQVVKEERGNKGAALTTYLSLAGRYCVLMPNTPRGGGISRKITNANDRKRLKSAAQALELPEGMGLIIRTAGENRTKLEIKRDYEYLLRMWDTIREITLKSNAPACVYEEGDLIKRAIRDLYNKDVSEVLVEGEDGYRNAKDFMRMLMPSHAKNVKQYKEPVPLYQRMHIEAQLDAMFSPTVTLRSGGYVVINQTEALVAIDVNSGRATREHSIEDTAYKTNLEAAEEVARQLRLRDLAGLIVIDFIDMEDGRNDRNVEKRLRDCVKNDRARVQIGKISQFGLLEMSRQRLRAGVVAGSTVPCPTCAGQGIVRSVESTALRVLRALDEEGQRQRANALVIYAPVEVAMYTLNQKRREIARMEQEYDIVITFQPKDDMQAGTFEMERIGQRTPEERPRNPALAEPLPPPPELTEEETEVEAAEGEPAEAESEREHAAPQEGQSGSDGNGRRRRRRRRRGRGERGPQQGQPQFAGQPQAQPVGREEGGDEGEDDESEDGEESTSREPAEAGAGVGPNGDGQGRRRRRRRRRGRRGPREGGPFQPSEPGSLEGVPVDATVREPGGEAPSIPLPFGEEPIAAPNAPSAPVWSLFPETPRQPEPEAEPAIESSVEEPEPVAVAIAEQAAPAQVTLHPREQAAAPDEPAQPSRKGWWQRPFRIRD